MRLTEAFDFHTNPDANPDRYTHFDPTLSTSGRAFDCTGDPDLLSTAAVVDAIEQRTGLCALPRDRWPATTNGKGEK